MEPIIVKTVEDANNLKWNFPHNYKSIKIEMKNEAVESIGFSRAILWGVVTGDHDGSTYVLFETEKIEMGGCSVAFAHAHAKIYHALSEEIIKNTKC